MRIKIITFLTLILLIVLDAVIPIPIIGLILIHVMFNKPLWFVQVVQKTYELELGTREDPEN